MLNGIMFVLIVFGILILYRLIKGPSIWDRILFLNLFTILLVLIIVIYAAIQELPYLIDMAIVFTLLGFISIVFIARFVQGKGKI